jgi:hypothetical protein
MESSERGIGRFRFALLDLCKDATMQLVGLSCERKGPRCEELRSPDVFRYWNGKMEAELSR